MSVAHRWLWARRFSQVTVLGLFLLGPGFGIHWLRGDLNASLLLEWLPMTDPLILLQSVLAGHRPQSAAWMGAGLILLFYFILGGRTYCSWVCPINPLTDLAAWLRRRLGLPQGWRPPAASRGYVLLAVLVLSAISGQIVWDWVNPITALQRGLMYGMGLGWALVLGVFLLDLLVVPAGWCGRLCPVGAFYGLLGRYSPLVVSAPRRQACNHCMDCYRICPERHILAPVLHRREGAGTTVLNPAACTRCARCLDVCQQRVFHLGRRPASIPEHALNDPPGLKEV